MVLFGIFSPIFTFLRVISEIKGLMLPDILHKKRGNLGQDVLQELLKGSFVDFCV